MKTAHEAHQPAWVGRVADFRQDLAVKHGNDTVAEAAQVEPVPSSVGCNGYALRQDLVRSGQLPPSVAKQPEAGAELIETSTPMAMRVFA